MDGAEVLEGGEGAYWDRLVRVLGENEIGKEVRTSKSNPPNFSPVRSKTGPISISPSLPHWLAGLRTGLNDYERGLSQR